MAGDSDRRDRNEARRIAIALIVLVLLLGVGLVLLLPSLGELAALHLGPGVGMRDAAVISFFTTIVLMIVFAVAAGDGFLGEIQFVLAAFFLFFLIIWLLVAWAF